MDPDQGLITSCAFDAGSWSLLVDLGARAGRSDIEVDPALVRYARPVAKLLEVSASPAAGRRC
jgi:hypothetical protein